MCDFCGATTNVSEVKHPEMVASTPYVRDLCSRCAKSAALTYYRTGAAPLGARGVSLPEATASSSGDQDVGPKSREW